jgi:hypothetical protein
MATKNHEQCLQQFRHAVISLQYPNTVNREALTGEENGRNPGSSQKHQIALQDDTGSYFIFANNSPRLWIPIITGRNNAQTELTISGSSNVVGSMPIYFSEGMIYYLKMELLSGTCDDADLELADVTFGTPTPFYKIGTDSLGNPNWKPTTDGDWIDTNVFGFRGLTNGGTVHYRMTNNAVGSIGLKMTIYATGVG